MEGCTTSHAAAFSKFEGYELADCGCAAGATCMSDCTAECAAPNTLTTTSPCGVCLLTEASKGTQSTCTTEAGITCLGDTTCQPFLQCANGC